jgi:putative hydrolase
MSDRPSGPDDRPDEPTGSGDGSGADSASGGNSAGDAWAAAVDNPGDAPSADTTGHHAAGEAAAGDQAAADGPAGERPDAGPRIGFGADLGGGRQDRPAGDRAEDQGMPDVAAMLQQLLGGGAGGSTSDLGELVRQLGGGTRGELPDLAEVMRQLGGAGGQLPDLNEIIRQLGGGSGQLPDLGELIRRFGGSGAPGGAGGDPMTDILKSMGVDPKDSGLLAMLQGQIAQMFAPQTTQSRMMMAADVARKTVAGADTDPTVTAAQQREVTEAVHVAQLWVDPVTTLDPPNGSGLAWSRAEWVEATMPTWHTLVEPVSTGVTNAVTQALKSQMGKLGADELAESIPGVAGLDLGALLDQVRPALEQLAGSMFSAQLGHGVGALAGDLLSGTEVGLPLLGTQDVALLPTNITAFAQGLGLDESEVRLYLAVREAARTRLFAQVPWLGPQLEAAVRDYARNITIDTDAIEEQIRSIDIQDPAAIQEALQNKLFSPTPTAAQRAALGRLETSLALVEGWVDLVTEQASTGHLPHAGALGEAVRRRRAGGPASKTFSGLVGLELRPRRLKDAKNLWAALENAGGQEFRDAPWSHPDIAPTGADLDDPLGYVEQRKGAGGADDVDSALDALLAGGDAPQDPTPAERSAGDAAATHEGPQDEGPQDVAPQDVAPVAPQDDGAQDEQPDDTPGTAPRD